MKKIINILMIMMFLLIAANTWAVAEETPMGQSAPAVTQPAPDTMAPMTAPATPASTAAPDPGGAKTGGIADVTAATAGKPTLEEAAATAGHNKVAINLVWTLIAAFLGNSGNSGTLPILITCPFTSSIST